jgi:hypothetical protein
MKCEGYTQDTKHGESLKSRIHFEVLLKLFLYINKLIYLDFMYDYI